MRNTVDKYNLNFLSRNILSKSYYSTANTFVIIKVGVYTFFSRCIFLQISSRTCKNPSNYDEKNVIRQMAQ